MAGYSSARKLTNVVGRVDYISNPKGEVIREANKLAEEMTKYYKSIEGKFDFGSRTPKEEFCRLYNIPCKSTFSVFLTADIREKFANFKELYPILTRKRLKMDLRALQSLIMILYQYITLITLLIGHIIKGGTKSRERGSIRNDQREW